MKKNNILSVLALAAMVTPAASCSNDENVVENKKKNPNDNTPRGVTAFTSVENTANTTTRTSMRNHTYKTGGDFMWEVGDLIWVEKTVTDRVKSSTSDITKTQPRAKFIVYGEYKSPTYNVYYTGANTTNGLDVNIATQQNKKSLTILSTSVQVAIAERQ